jgi:two-component system chemotaxis response regulator CheY
MQEEPSKRVLIVDDDPDIRMTLHDWLGSQGYLCEAAEHGAAAVARLKTGHIDLVITDHHMPVMDGLHLIEWLAGTPHRGAIPVILLSSDSSETVRMRAMAAGVRSILAKPYCREELLSAVARAFASRAHRESSSD